MTWTYNVTDLSTSENDQIRLETGDTDSSAPLLQDEEIEQAISVERNYWSSAARCCEMIGTLFMRRVDTKLGRAMQIVYSKTAQGYFDRARLLRCKAMGTVVPYIGGAYVADKVAIQTDTGLLEPFFERNMMENPWTGGYSPDALAPQGYNQAEDIEEDV